MATENCCPARKTREQWNWQTVTLPDVSPQGQQCADAEGRIWYLQSENEIGIWDGKETKTLALTAGLEGQIIKVLAADAQGRIWIGTDQTLAVWQTNHFEVMTPTNGEAGAEREANRSVRRRQSLGGSQRPDAALRRTAMAGRVRRLEPRTGQTDFVALCARRQRRRFVGGRRRFGIDPRCGGRRVPAPDHAGRIAQQRDPLCL